MKTIKIIHLLISIIASIGLHAQGLSFSQSKISADKASLANDAYYANYTIAKANFSPELQYPIQLSYDSSNKSAGILGFGWSVPQLESFISFNG